ncbi:hypothetical protein GGS23DRAFT_593764 [Durotheca rogersii]|uniref:uncharacterized protein n=1 Tax=Durotheca rogersii TaxID=419775 RepID=UPI00221F2F59|nr:uncharacterized protein GGS23DRAFT_593764 [Durotheca rogersii]KAI5867034.1 hypothetical protein GGS23DRAFT_593764 [Durotheca rogersii]
MGLAGRKNRRKLEYDPNNLRWSRDETTFGHKIMRTQGWEPGKLLGVQDSAHAHLHTAASSAPIKVFVKDDTSGLGAKPRQKQSDECTGLDSFKDLIGRLNGKSEETIQKEQQVRLDFKTSLFVERRYGPMRFVSGGLLVGEQIKELAITVSNPTIPRKTSEEEPATTPEGDTAFCIKKEKREKKSKKRKAEEGGLTDEADVTREKRRKKRSTSDGTPDGFSGDLGVEKSSKKKSKKLKQEEGEEEEKELGDNLETTRRRKKSRGESKEGPKQDTEAGASILLGDMEVEVKKAKSKKAKKEKGRKGKEERQTSVSGLLAENLVSTESSTPSQTGTPQESGVATPTPTGTGTSTPQSLSTRHYVRSRNIASKRMAMADLQALNQIFMVKSVA